MHYDWKTYKSNTHILNLYIFIMKTTILLTTALAVIGLSVSPGHANVAEVNNNNAAEAPAQNTATVYVVNVKGKGWGVATRASMAIKSQDGVKKILMSGYRATVVMEEGKSLDEAKTKAAIEGKNLSLASFSKSQAVIPEAGYVLAVTGTGWADTNEKARVALEKVEGITGAYVNRGITLHLAKAGDLDKDKIAEALKPFRMVIRSVKPMQGKPF